MAGLEKYKDMEIKDIISSVAVREGKAKDSGNTYYYLEINLINGYQTRMFVNSDAMFAWLNALESLDND